MNPSQGRLVRPSMAGPGGSSRLHIPDHELIRTIGSGSYGEVWLARSALGAFRAVKILRGKRFENQRPFDREFEGIQRFEPISREHPGFVDILQVGRDAQAGFLYYVMELADPLVDDPTRPFDPQQYRPRTLAALLPPKRGHRRSDVRGGLPLRDCLEIGCALARAVAYLHELNLIHRDIKPSNIIFVKGVPKLADVGLVASTDGTCSFVGTEEYLPNEGPGRPAADIFALGKVLYEMATGFSAREYPRWPDDWSKADHNEDLEPFTRLVICACERDPRRRFASAGELADDLDLLLGGKSLLIRNLQRSLRRQRWTIAGLAGAFALSLMAVGLWVYRKEAATQAWRRELRDLQISRMRLRPAGWFSDEWVRMERAAGIRTDPELVQQAFASLAGWDAQLVRQWDGLPATSAAFGVNGDGLIAGIPGSPTLLIHPDGTTNVLGALGQGPLCWPASGPPLILTVLSNDLALREAPSGAVRTRFPLATEPSKAPSGQSVLAVSAAGEKVAAASSDGVFLWDFGGQLLGKLLVPATALAFSPNAALLGVGLADGGTRVYQVPSLEEIALLPSALRGSPVTCLAFAPDPVVRAGEKRANAWILAVGDQGAGIVIWDLTRQIPRSFCRGSTWTVTALAFSQDSALLASAGRNQPRLWDAATGQPLLALPAVGGGATLALAFDSNDERLLYGGLGGAGTASLALAQLQRDHGVRTLRGLIAPIRKVWFSADSQRIAALGDDWRLAAWNGVQLAWVFETPVGEFADGAAGQFHPVNGTFAFAAGDTALLWDLNSAKVLRQWKLPPGSFDNLEWDAAGQLLLLRLEPALSEARQIWRLYHLGESLQPELRFEQTDRSWESREAIFVPRAQSFLVASTGPAGSKRVLRAYDSATGKIRWQTETQRDRHDLGVYVDLAGRFVAYTHWPPQEHFNGPNQLIGLPDFQPAGLTVENAEAVAPSGKEFATRTAYFPQVGGPTYGIPLTVYQGGPSRPVFSPDGASLAWGTAEGLVHIANLAETRKRIHALLGKNERR